MSYIRLCSDRHVARKVENRVHDGNSMDECDLLAVADRVGLGQVDLHPGAGNRRRREGGRCRGGQLGGGDRRRHTAAEDVGEEVGSRLAVKVDETVDREPDRGRGVVDARVLDRARGIAGGCEPNTQLLEIARLAAREGEGEATIGARRERELYLLLRPTLGEGDRERTLRHIKAAGDKVPGILHRNLGEIDRAAGEGRRDRVGTGDGADDLREVLEINLKLHGRREHVRREGESAARQRRGAVGEAEVDVARTLDRVGPVSRGGHRLAAQEENLLLLARVLAQGQGLDKVLRTGNVIELGGTIAVTDTADQVVAPAKRDRQADTAATAGLGELECHQHFGKSLIGIKSHSRRAVGGQGLQALEETVVGHRGMTLFHGVLLPRVEGIDAFPWTDRSLHVKRDLSLHLLYFCPRFLFCLQTNKVAAPGHSHPGLAMYDFWKFVLKPDDPNACWIWQGYRNKSGYGKFNVDVGVNSYAHRYCWTITNGDIPEDKHVLHKCNHGHLGCVRLDHLYLGTVKDNARDRTIAGTNNTQKLSVADLPDIRARLAAGELGASIARDYGVSPTAISRIKLNKSFANL